MASSLTIRTSNREDSPSSCGSGFDCLDPLASLSMNYRLPFCGAVSRRQLSVQRQCLFSSFPHGKLFGPLDTFSPNFFPQRLVLKKPNQLVEKVPHIPGIDK